jgi:hypothetical protein
LYRKGEALIPTFRRMEKPKRGLPSHDGAVGVAKSLAVVLADHVVVRLAPFGRKAYSSIQNNHNLSQLSFIC